MVLPPFDNFYYFGVTVMEGVYYTEGVYWRGASYGLVHTEWLKGAFIRQEAFI